MSSIINESSNSLSTLVKGLSEVNLALDTLGSPTIETDLDQIAKGANIVGFNLLVRQGKIPGCQRRQFRAFIPSLDTSAGFVTTFGSGVVTQLVSYETSNTTVYISSTNAGDNAVLRVRYLDDNFEEQTNNTTLNGQTEVAVVGDDFYRNRDFRFSSGTATVGDIYLYSVSGNTNGIPNDLTSVQSCLPAGSGRSADINYTPKLGTKGFIESIQFAIASQTGGNLLSRSNFVKADGIPSRGALSLIPDNTSKQITTESGGIQAGTTFSFEVSGDSNNIDVSFQISLLEIDTVVYDAWVADGEPLR